MLETSTINDLRLKTMEENLREKIAFHLKERGINLLEFSKTSRIAYSTLHGVMSGKGSARIETVEKIANGFGVDPGVLLGLSKAVTDKERELDERLRLLSLIPRLDKGQVAAFLAMIEKELGLSNSDPAARDSVKHPNDG